MTRSLTTLAVDFFSLFGVDSCDLTKDATILIKSRNAFFARALPRLKFVFGVTTS